MTTTAPYPTPTRSATTAARIVIDLAAGTVEIDGEADDALELAAQAALGAGLRVLAAARGGAR